MGEKWGSRLGAERWWALAPPGQSVACIRARGEHGRTDGREHNSARREMLVGSLGQGSTGTDRLARHTWVLFFTVLVNKFHR